MVLPILPLHIQVVLVVVLIGKVVRGQETNQQFHHHKEILVVLQLPVLDPLVDLAVVELVGQVATIMELLVVLEVLAHNCQHLSEIQRWTQHQTVEV